MPSDEVQPLVGMSEPQVAGTAGALLRLIRLSRAETADISLFIAPGRLPLARQRLMAGLFAGQPPQGTRPCNDN
ncbi:MAG: hypothetical protein EON47_08890 [Acetobacteraceae bacterium]|nr:MAG: hypothetical protein EON47_08890 [Acetobacteraceae bacterium]